ncbi:hypothetical protein [Falsochrobactrum tianjinense]|uniref:hypothetical protein n=1 Tax=Falsochrobactrum tianjinense TaxID=2706015 RepID=UPI0020C91DED|nr:hypothetical protein [Falsochrobactrum sp. TDYN1]
MRSPAIWQHLFCLEQSEALLSLLFHIFQYINISAQVNIAEAVLAVHKPHAIEIGNRLADQSSEFDPHMA